MKKTLCLLTTIISLSTFADYSYNLYGQGKYYDIHGFEVETSNLLARELDPRDPLKGELEEKERKEELCKPIVPNNSGEYHYDIYGQGKYYDIHGHEVDPRNLLVRELDSSDPLVKALEEKRKNICKDLFKIQV